MGLDSERWGCAMAWGYSNADNKNKLLVERKPSIYSVLPWKRERLLITMCWLE